ncbi:hypothetical protein [Acinetobacter sp. S4397-1]|nr:hypothetical protein [Acinetobacter sp. S4397-1]
MSKPRADTAAGKSRRRRLLLWSVISVGCATLLKRDTASTKT